MTLVQRAGLDTPDRREQTGQALAKIGEEKIRYVRLAFPDLMGVLRGRMVQATRLEHMFVEGCSFGSRLLLTDLIGEVHPSVQLGATYDYGNFYLLPEPSTLLSVPWLPGTGIILADPYLPDGNRAVSSRLALKQAIEYAATVNFKLLVGLEVESSVFPTGDAPRISERQHLFTALGQGLAAPVLMPLWDTLNQIGIGLDGYVNEFAPGEIEFNLSPQPALRAADEFLLMKLAAREMLRPTGYDLTFMAMFDNDRAGMTSGLHVHQAGFDEQGRNLFYDPTSEHGLSKTLLHFIGGQLSHARQLAVLSTPTITGYRRYCPGTWAPINATWGLDNRTVMLRVMPDRGPSTRIENRLPDSAANPYLMLAAMILAGVEGIENQATPPPPTTGSAMIHPVSLPRHIWEAIQCLEEPSTLTASLGQDLIMAYRGILLLAAERFSASVSEWEIEEYRCIL